MSCPMETLGNLIVGSMMSPPKLGCQEYDQEHIPSQNEDSDQRGFLPQVVEFKRDVNPPRKST